MFFHFFAIYFSLQLRNIFPYTKYCWFRPEVCRTFHFGAHGVSNAQYSKYLNAIHLNDEFVRFSEMDLSYLEKTVWEESYLGAVRRSAEVTMENIDSTAESEVHIKYNRISEDQSPGSFGQVSIWLGAMNNIKAMVPRTAFKGVVTVRRGAKLVHIAPISIFGGEMKT